MRAPRLAPLLAVLALCAGGLLAGCGKGSPAPSAPAGGGPARRIAPVTAAGAVSVVTRNTTRLGGDAVATDAAAVARAVYPGLTAATRPQLVVLVDARNWPAALAASQLAGAPLQAPILFSEGDVLPQVSREALETLEPLGASALGGVQVLRIATNAPVPKGYLTRSLPAAEAPLLAASIERLGRSAGAAAAHQAIVVPADAAHAMQMPAAGLSAESAAPILLVQGGHVPAATKAALVALHRPSIYVIDASAVGSSALAHLRHLGSVTEISGSGSAEQAGANAIAVARFTDGRFGWGIKEPGHGLVFANVSRPLDAPAAALLSATADYGPLLLLEAASQVSPALASYLGDIQPAYTEAFNFRPVRGVYNHGWLIGDVHAIAPVTQAEIDSLLEINPRKQTSEESSAGQVE